MLKRLALLSVPAAAVALLGASIVFAQHSPGGEGLQVAVPQATPGAVQPNVPTEPDKPILPNGQPVPLPTVTPTVGTPPQSPQQPLPPLNTNPNVPSLIANIPANLMPVIEARPVPSPLNLAAMTAAPADLRPVIEARPLQSFANPAAMTADFANPPVQEAKPLPSSTSAAAMVIVPPDLLPVREAPSVITGRP